MSHRPGMRDRPDASMISAPGGLTVRTSSAAPTAEIRSPVTTTDMPARAGAPGPSMTVTFSMRSTSAVVGADAVVGVDSLVAFPKPAQPKRNRAAHTPRRLTRRTSAPIVSGAQSGRIRAIGTSSLVMPLDAELAQVVVEVPILEDVPVARPHAPEARMRVGKLHRRRRSEPLDQLRHELSVLLPPETGCAEGAGRRLDLPLRPGQAIDGLVPQQRTVNRSGRHPVQLPLAQGKTQTAGQTRQELLRLHTAPKTRVLRGQRRQPIQNGLTSPLVTQRSWTITSTKPLDSAVECLQD